MRIVAIILVSWTSLWSSAFAQTQAQRDDAKWILERITGVKWPSDSEVMKQAVTLSMSGDRAAIAQLATQQSQFLNVTVKNFGLQMSTREETVRLPLNEFAAGIIGVTRDERDARELLYGNFIYVGDANIGNDSNTYGATILASNKHYEALDNHKNNIGAALVRINSQRLIASQLGGTFILAANPDPAGILTSRTWMEAHADAGTNRRAVEYTFREFMCLPLSQWADAMASDVRIGRDVDRFPGGNHQRFQTTCKACHNVMDGFRGAWAKWNFENDSAVQSSVRRGNSNAQGIMNKMNQNASVYPGGYITTDDSWINNAANGINITTFGWRGTDGITPTGAGMGLNTFGRLVANSRRFSTCMAKRVFETVCQKELTANDLSVFQAMGSQFEGTNYNLKQLFVSAALNPRCK